MGEEQGLPNNNGQVLPPTNPFSVTNILHLLTQLGAGGPAGGTASAADLAAQVALARNGASPQVGAQQNAVQAQSQSTAQNQRAVQPSQPQTSGSMLDYFRTPSPPTWTPPPPSTPAVVTPGTPQYILVQKQEEARNNPDFRPTGKRGEPDRQTRCNIATVWQVEQVGGNTDALIDPATGEAALVNQQYQQLSAPGSGYHLGAAEEAQDFTNRTGVPALAVQPNPKGHGHITTLIPEMLPGTQKHTGQAPLVNNIGARWEVSTADKAFSSKLPVYYFIPDK
jgi:hypothetical protein